MKKLKYEPVKKNPPSRTGFLVGSTSDGLLGNEKPCCFFKAIRVHPAKVIAGCELTAGIAEYDTTVSRLNSVPDNGLNTFSLKVKKVEPDLIHGCGRREFDLYQ
jgi:hypothetical protein